MAALLRIAAGTLGLAVIAVFSACGGAGTSEGISASNADASPSDGAASGDGPRQAQDDAGSYQAFPGEEPGTGFVNLRYPFDDRNSAGAFFVVARGADPCETRDEGICRVRHCPQIDGGVIGREIPSTYTSAGEIRVSGGDAFSLTIRPDSKDFYEPVSSGPGGHFLGGEDVRFQAGGGKLPAFDVTARFPLVLLLERPAVPQPVTGSIPVSRTHDLELAWTRGDPDVELWAQSSVSPSDPRWVYAACRIPSMSGHATILGSTLRALAPQTRLGLFTVARRGIRQGEFDTTLAVAADVYTPDKREPVELIVE